MRDETNTQKRRIRRTYLFYCPVDVSDLWKHNTNTNKYEHTSGTAIQSCYFHSDMRYQGVRWRKLTLLQHLYLFKWLKSTSAVTSFKCWGQEMVFLFISKLEKIFNTIFFIIVFHLSAFAWFIEREKYQKYFLTAGFGDNYFILSEVQSGLVGFLDPSPCRQPCKISPPCLQPCKVSPCLQPCLGKCSQSCRAGN